MADLNLVVMRHGETDFNREGRYQGSIDTSLNEAGRRQVVAALEALRPFPIRQIVSSPLARARESAEIVAEALAVPIEDHVAFVERRFGILEGLTRAEMLERHPGVWRDGLNRQFHAGAPEGESLFELGIRVRQGLSELYRRHGGKTVLLVCHGGVARSIHGILRRPFDAEYFSYVLGNAEVDSYTIRVDPVLPKA